MVAQLQGVEVNRRTARRVQLKFPLWFQTQKHPDVLQSGMVQNMSAAGAVFVTQELVEVSTGIKLFLDRLPGDRQGRHVHGVVTRTEVAGEPGQYLIGVQFMDVSEAQQAHIVAALQATDIMGLLRSAAKKGASDLHLSAHHPPLVRLAGHLQALRKTPLSGPDVRDMIYTLLDDRQRRVFERDLELDFSLSVTPLLRFRVNVHMQRGNVEAAFRRIAPEVRTFEELHLPEVVQRLAELRDGLVLVTGPAGAGKTTTVAAMVEHINTSRAAMIITLENPIEHVYTHKHSVIKQREIGVDTRSCPVALREAMRQDPDVIVIGEIRDHETMQAALDTAETGHLVLATMLAEDCVQSILRTYHFFPSDRQAAIQWQLAHCLRGIISLRMLPQANASGMVPGTEVLVCTDGIAHMIRNGTVAQIPSAIQTGARYGMQTFAKSMEAIYKVGHITSETLKEYS